METDYGVVWLTLKLALITALICVPLGLVVGRWLARRGAAQAWWVDALLLLPLIVPPTVFGLYFLGVFSGSSWVFSFHGLVLASVLVNLPFAVFPIRRAWEQIPTETLEGAACAGWPPGKVFTRCELPQAWHGIVSAFALVAAHTVGEFGVVMMVGGNIEGETRTMSLAIYDYVQSMNMNRAHSLALTCVALGAIVAIASHVLNPARWRRRLDARK